MLPTDAAARKALPIFTGVVRYFPRALAEIASVSKSGNDQHNPGQPLGWSKGKSTDHADCAQRHLIEHGTIDTDGQRHTAKSAWRIMALLEMELEAEAAGMSYDAYIAQLKAAVEAPKHTGAAGTRSGLGRLPCGCKAYEGGTMMPQRDPGDECEGPVCTCGARRTLQHNLGCPMRDWRPHYSEQEDLSPDARYGS